MTVLEPDEGPVGTEVVIRGENFGPSIGALQGTSGVSFGGVWASPSTWSEGEVRVEVPAGATTGAVVVTVSGVGSEGLAFTVTGAGTGGPAVGTVSPAQGAAGTEVVIRGTDFGPPEGAEQGTAGVSFNGVAGTPASWSGTEIRVPVPEGATAGPVVVTVGGEASNGVGFTVTGAGAARPSIVSVSPELATAGTEVVIRGENFGDPEGAAQGRRGVSFGGVWAEPTLWSEGEIRATVPEGFPGGQVVVVVDGEASDGAGFTVTGPGPVIETVDPTHGPEGTGVVIRGEHFGSPIAAAQGRAGVSFGGVWAEASFWSGTEIRAAVPAGGESGLVAVTAGGQESNGVDFTVPAGGKGLAMAREAYASSVGKGEPAGPEITSVTPDEGPVGTSVTVAGTGFGAVQGTSTVSFNDTAGVPTSWSETEIQVPVPAGAATCAPEGTPVTVEVTVGGQKSNGGEYRLDPPIIIEVSDTVVSEPDGEVTITVRRDPFQFQTVAYGYRGTAKRGIGKDYYVVNRLVFPPGSNTGVTTLRVLDDLVYEGDETIEIVATVRDLGGKECEISEEILLEDDELPPLAISVITHQHGGLELSRLREGEPAYRTFAVTVSVPEGEAPATDTTITLVSGGTASSETDYTLAETVTLGVGKGSVETPLTVIDDDPFEVPETLTLQATDDADEGYQPSPEVTVWIYDDNYSKLTVSAEASTVSEPNGTVRVTMSVEEGKDLASDATVFLGFGLTPTATHKTDFRLTKRLTLRANRSSVSTVLSVIDDGAYEGDERIELLASGDGTSALSQSEILTLQLEDDDPTITGFAPTHGGEGVVVTISGDNFTEQGTTVQFNGVKVEASKAKYVSATEIQATVPPEAATGPITVKTPGGTVTSTASFTVLRLCIQVDPATVKEKAGERTAMVTVSVDDAVDQDLPVAFTFGGTADRGRFEDYTMDQTVTIPLGGTSAEKTLTVIDDSDYEEEETITIQAGAEGYEASTVATVALISDDDPELVLACPLSLEESHGTEQIGVYLPFARDADTLVSFTFEGRATRGTDYTMDQMVTIDGSTSEDEGNTSAEIPLTVIDDRRHEGDETIDLTASAVGYQSAFCVFSIEADANDPVVPPISCSVSSTSIAEAGGTSTVTVSVAEGDAPDADIPVTLSFGGTATHGTDYTLTRTVTIPADGTSAEATLTAVDDSVDESNETVEVTASAGEDVTCSTPTVTIVDDDTAGITVTPTSLSITEGGSKSYQVKLDTQPLDTVEVSMSSDNGDVGVPSTALTFTTATGVPGGWDRFQSVTVRIAHDDNTSDENGIITHSATSDDSDYAGIAIASVSVSVSDDDDPPSVCSLTSISNQTVNVGASKTLSLSSSNCGANPTYSAISSETSKVTVVVTGSSLKITGKAKGSTTVTVTVSGASQSDTDTFTVTVVSSPEPCLLTSIDNQTVKKGGETTVTLSADCGDDPTYSARSNDTTIATVSVSGSTLTITGVETGSTTVWYTVSGLGQTSSKPITVTVVSSPEPCLLTSIDNQTVNVGASKTLSLSSVCNGTYTATSSDTSKVTVSVSGNRLTVTGVAVGSANVTVKVTKSGYAPDTDTFTVTVVMPSPVIDRISPNLGQTDTGATIYGANFGTDEGSVSFGGSSADINSWNDTWISVLVPLHLSVGTVSVSVTTAPSAGSKTSINSVSFRVTGSPARSEEEECEDKKDCPEGEGGDEEQGDEEQGEEEGGEGEGDGEAGETEEDPSGG